MTTARFFLGSTSLFLAASALFACASGGTDDGGAADVGGSELNVQQSFDCTLADGCELQGDLGFCVTQIHFTKDQVEVTTTPRSVADEDPKGAAEGPHGVGTMGCHNVTAKRIDISWTEGDVTGVIQADKSGSKFVGKGDINGFGLKTNVTCQ